MSNELMNHSTTFEVNGEDVKLSGMIVKQYLTRGNDDVSDQEVVMFVNLCKYQKLNPFLNEAYLVKFKNAPAQIIVGKEALMKKAEANSQYDGMQAGIIIKRNDEILEVEGSFMLKTDHLLGGWARVYRKDRKHPYVIKVELSEYNKGKSTWNQFPKTMIRKTAIVQAMREAFPVELGAMYTEEEALPTEGQKVTNEIKQNANQEVLDVEPEPISEAKKEDTVIVEAEYRDVVQPTEPEPTPANNGAPF